MHLCSDLHQCEITKNYMIYVLYGDIKVMPRGTRRDLKKCMNTHHLHSNAMLIISSKIILPKN